jgi:hypothetical protein
VETVVHHSTEEWDFSKPDFTHAEFTWNGSNKAKNAKKSGKDSKDPSRARSRARHKWRTDIMPELVS